VYLKVERWHGMAWCGLAHDRSMWRVVVNMVMNI